VETEGVVRARAQPRVYVRRGVRFQPRAESV